MNLHIIADGNIFKVTDERGTHYGPTVATRDEAEALLSDWRTYYDAPLRFIPVARGDNAHGWVEVPETAKEPITEATDAKSTTAINSAPNGISTTFELLPATTPNVLEPTDIAGVIAPTEISSHIVEMSPKANCSMPGTAKGRPAVYFSDSDRKAEAARRLKIKRAWIARVGLDVYRSMVKDQNSAIHAFPLGHIEGNGQPSKPISRKPSISARVKGIPYPIIAPEVVKQIEAYTYLKDKGYDVHAEVTSEAGRLDLVVYDAERRPRIVIEVKPRRQGWSEGQKQKYEELVRCVGARLYLHNQSTSLDTLLDEVKAAMADSLALAA